MSSPIARRYAQALHAQAAEQNAVARVDDDVALLRETLQGSPDLAQALTSPVVPRAAKERIVDSLFGERLSATAVGFLRFLIEKGREENLVGIADAYQTLRDTQEGVVEARVKTALPMPDAEQKALRKALEARTGKTVRLLVSVAPDLIGGLVIRLGDTVYDGSVRNKLAELREKMDVREVSLN